jgi:long-chain acyl-CoA synthetase
MLFQEGPYPLCFFTCAADSMISYLPLAHIFDRTSEEMFLKIGGCIGYWQGVLPELINDIAALKPTMFVGVPRVFDRIQQRISDRVAGSGCIKSLLFKWGFNGKLARLNAGFSSDTAAPFWDKLVFSKVFPFSLTLVSVRVFVPRAA